MPLLGTDGCSRVWFALLQNHSGVTVTHWPYSIAFSTAVLIADTSGGLDMLTRFGVLRKGIEMSRLRNAARVLETTARAANIPGDPGAVIVSRNRLDDLRAALEEDSGESVMGVLAHHEGPSISGVYSMQVDSRDSIEWPSGTRLHITKVSG